jgi:YjbE family integral membrane protein
MSIATTGAALLQISWINIILSGDNAMVIALACRSLRGKERQAGIVLGATAAVVLRIAFTLGMTEILILPFARAIAGGLLLFIAIKLLLDDEEEDAAVHGHESLMRAMGTIVVADIIMSLDNVVAVAAAAKGSIPLIVFGLAMSVPIVVAGSTLIVSIVKRFPIVVWIGSAFLGWIAGETIAGDNFIHPMMPGGFWHDAAPFAGAVLVVAVGIAWTALRRKPDAAGD